MRFHFLILFIIVFSFCGCSSSRKTTFQKYDLGDTNHFPITDINFSKYILPLNDYQKAYIFANPDRAMFLAETEIHKQAANALKHVKQCELQKAAEIYTEIAKTEDSLDWMWKYFPHFYYQTTYKWDKLEQAKKNMANATDSIFIPYQNLPEFNIFFNQNADTIPLEIKNGVPCIKLEINGKLYWFIIDTGCMFTSVFKNIAEDLNINIFSDYKRGGVGADGYFTVTAGILNEFKLNNIIFKNLPVSVIMSNSIDVNFLFINLAKFDGTIGWDLLQQFDFTIDYKNRQLILRKPEKKKNKNKNLFWYNIPIFQCYAKENGCPLLLFFDSGSSYTQFEAKSLKFILGIDTAQLKSKSKKMHGVQTSKKMKYWILPEFSFCTLVDTNVNCLNITNAKVSDLEEFAGWSSLIINGVLGSDCFLDKAIRVDILNGIFEIYE